MFCSIISVVIAGLVNVGGIEVAFDIANKGGRLRLFDLSPVSPKLNLRVGGSPGLVVMGEES